MVLQSIKQIKIKEDSFEITGVGIINVIVGNIYRPIPVLHCEYKHFVDEFAPFL